jgi:DNA-binding transcriptional ArsR family regulator
MVDYRGNPAVHIFADTEAALARMRRTAEAAGCRIVSGQLTGEDADPSAAIPGAAILIELEGDAAGEAAIHLLDWIRDEAVRGARRSVVSAPAGLIDLVAALAWHEGVVQLCEASEEERLAAVAGVGPGPAARLHDSRRERDFPILQPVSGADEAPAGPDQARADAAYIRTMLRARRLRTHYFRADLFADPVWDMLLDLMAARLEGKKVAVSSLCIAAAVPPTTALRWLNVLTDGRLVVRIADPEDGRRVHIELADATARALAAWLREARRMVAKVV